jgi:hypothetical protein
MQYFPVFPVHASQSPVCLQLSFVLCVQACPFYGYRMICATVHIRVVYQIYMVYDQEGDAQRGCETLFTFQIDF